MAFIEFQFPSANGQDTVWGWKVTPLGAPKAAVQLIHGYGEHSRRYLHMALAFAEEGIAVYAERRGFWRIAWVTPAPKLSKITPKTSLPCSL